MAETFLSYPIFKDFILPFLLVFAIVFAVLQKSEILGKGKRQIDAIVALAVGLLVVSVGYATDIITNLMPFLAVGLVVILVFMLLWGMTFKEGTFEMPFGVKIAAGILILIALIIAVLYFTGSWNYVVESVSGQGSNWITNILFVLLIAGAIAVVVGFGGKPGKGGEKKED
jgi:hypothetical protein